MDNFPVNFWRTLTGCIDNGHGSRALPSAKMALRFQCAKHVCFR
jgi:hypothetical protein